MGAAEIMAIVIEHLTILSPIAAYSVIVQVVKLIVVNRMWHIDAGVTEDFCWVINI